MTELNTKATSGADSETSGSDITSDNVSTSGDADSELAALRNHNAKLLKQIKNFSSELNGLKSYKEEKEEKEMLQKEEFTKVIESLKSKITSLKSENEGLKSSIKGAKINSSLLGELSKFGFVDSPETRNAALKLIAKDAISIDPTTDTVIGADNAAKSFYEQYGKLGFFGKKTPGVSNDAPGVNPELDERAAYLKELRAAKTQKELDAVRAKYGKS